MLLIYGDVKLTDFTVSGSASGSDAPEILTDTAALNDFHSGLVTTFSFVGGPQSTASYVDIGFNILPDKEVGGIYYTNIGAFGVVNAQGLPEGTLIEFRSAGGTSFGTQRLRYGPQGMLQAWMIVKQQAAGGSGGSSVVVRVYNDVDGLPSIPAEATFGFGEFMPGRLIYLPTMSQRQPQAALVDPTSTTTEDGGSTFPSARRSSRSVAATFGTFATADVNSSAQSTVSDGAGGTISLRRLQEIFAASRGMAICDIAGKGLGKTPLVDGLRYDQEFMQENWIMALIQNKGGTITMDQSPRWSWQTNWKQSV